MIRLRGHHLLCLLGYRGMGYSREYTENMTRIHETLRARPETEILLTKGPDDLCEKFPESQPYHCENTNIYDRDAAVLEKLNLHTGQKIAWGELLDKVRQAILPGDIAGLCSTCFWRSYGFCEEGIEKLREF